MKQSKTNLNFPSQKISDKKKTDKWYKDCAKYASSLMQSGGMRQSFENKKENYDLRANIINPHNFKKYIDVDEIGLDKMPSQFKHVGIGNSKINLLVGEYIKRRKDFKAFLSANDKEGVSRKESNIKKELEDFVMERIKKDVLDPEELEKEIANFQKYIKYDFQDILEITSNKILKKEYKEQFLGFLLEEAFEDLLIDSDQCVHIDVLGGKPVMRKVNTMNLYSWGSAGSRILEDAEIIVEFGYAAPGKILDDYWDELSEKDLKDIDGHVNGSNPSADISVYDRFGPNFDDGSGMKIFPVTKKTQNYFGADMNGEGELRIVRTSWKGRRKVKYIKWYEDGEAMFDYRNEDYILDDVVGEELVATRWLSEWYQTTEIANGIFTKMQPIPFQARSLSNPSLVTPNYIGTVGDMSFTDIIKPLDYAYDIGYWKREIAIATYKGSAALMNISMIPSGWEPEAWVKYLTINKIGWLDPTAEILKGPSQGRSAGNFNTLTGTSVNLGGDASEIQMYNDYLFNIEQTMGKICGVTAAREGTIGSREAVSNVEREINQTSHITEKWFSIQNNFVKRALKKFLEACQYAYKDNPMNGSYLLDDMGQVFIESIDEFPSAEFDLHISDSTSDAQLMEDLKALAHAAIQNGNADLSDIIDMYQSESTQELSRKLKNSAEELRERNEKMQKEQNEVAKQANQLAAQEKAADREWEIKKHDDLMEIKRAELEIKRESKFLDIHQNERNANRDLDQNMNGLTDEIELGMIELDKQQSNQNMIIEKDKLKETIRHNKAQEVIDRKKVSSKNNNTSK